MNGTLKVADENHNLWLYLAARGVAVFALDYRTRFIPHDYQGDLAFMRDWTVERFVADAEISALEVQQLNPTVPMYIAGFSRGVTYAYALTGRVKAAGLIALDGSFKQVTPRPFDLAATLAEFDSSAQFASSVSRRGYAACHELMRRALETPDGPSLDERYDSASEHLVETLYNAWGPGVLSNTRDGMSPIGILATEMDQYDWFFPRIQDIEGKSMRSRPDDPSTGLDDHFGKMNLPVIYFGKKILL